MSYRTHTCGELTTSDLGSTIKLSGWIDSLRNMGGLVFIDLRDRYGITQITLDPAIVGQEIVDKASKLHNEYVVSIAGEVIARPDNMKNPDMTTGEIEIRASDLEVLSASKVLPFAIAPDPKTSEENRMKYRYLDLRREQIKDNIVFRARMNQFTRDRFTEQGFLEVQTPIFSVSSPEWSRDYLIPSRINPGKFYALPQAPQQYKQLLMVWGIDKYFQIAPCFRDEDPRSDRAMCEFYQIDFEMSFVKQEDVMQIIQQFSLEAAKTLTPDKSIKFGDDIPHISYRDAMNRYGIDRPDLRFGMEIEDFSDLFAESEFALFASTIQDWGYVRALKLDQQTMSRKEIDALTDHVKRIGAGGLPYLIFEEDEVRGSVAKALSENEIETMRERLDAKSGDMAFFWVWSYAQVCKTLHHTRIYLRDKYDLVSDDELAFCFVVDFPFFEQDEETWEWDYGHNPFSEVVGGLEALETQDIAEIMTHQYDIVLNGFEIGGWSIRNHNPEILVKVFEKLGYDESYIKEQFGTMYEAFQYGVPPHGGCAFGFDRLMMILTDEPNIREVYAFPKSGRAQDVMMGAPSLVEPQDLEELSIEVKVRE